MKNGVECYKDFFPYFKALKTNCDRLGLLWLEVPGYFFQPDFPGNIICISVPALVTIPRGPRKATFLTFFFFLLKNDTIKPFRKTSIVLNYRNCSYKIKISYT